MKFSLSILLCICAFMAKAAAAENLIRVRGQGELKVAPDIAHISVEVWSRDKDAKKTQETNAKELARVEKVLKDKFKIDEKDIQTTHLNLSPDYRYDSGKRTLLGYQGSHSLQVTVRNLKKVGNLMDELVGESSDKVGTNLQGVHFSTDKRLAYETECLANAVANAREKANAIAKASGKSIKDITAIVESGAQWDDGPKPLRAMKMEMMADTAGSASTNVSPGQITISTQVLAEFNF